MVIRTSWLQRRRERLLGPHTFNGITGTGTLLAVAPKPMFLSSCLLAFFVPGLLPPCSVLSLLRGKLLLLFTLSTILTRPGPMGHPAATSAVRLSRRTSLSTWSFLMSLWSVINPQSPFCWGISVLWCMDQSKCFWSLKGLVQGQPWESGYPFANV